jgi:hypothetical protein
MAPDAWHCVDRNSQMAEWIFHFPSGCVTWWRYSQNLEPKENASQGDEVLLLSRHLILAGWYMWPCFNLFFQKQVTYRSKDYHPLEVKKEADRPKKIRREYLICLVKGQVFYWLGRNNDTLRRTSSSRALEVRKSEAWQKHQEKMKTSRGLLSITGITKSFFNNPEQWIMTAWNWLTVYF